MELAQSRRSSGSLTVSSSATGCRESKHLVNLTFRVYLLFALRQGKNAVAEAAREALLERSDIKRGEGDADGAAGRGWRVQRPPAPIRHDVGSGASSVPCFKAARLPR